MDAELQEIRDFLAGSPDFAVLPATALDRLPKQMIARYLRRGSVFPPEKTQPSDLWVVRTGAVDLRNEQDELLDKLGEGDVFATPGNGEAAFHVAGRVVEDALFYLLPAHEAQELQRQFPDFGDRFDRARRRPLQQALSALAGGTGHGDSVLTVSVGELVTRAPETIAPEATIQDTALRMSEREVSALLVMSSDRLVGIVTDHDLRKRCLATGLSRKEPVGSIMTSRLQTVTPETPAFEALLLMSRLDIHHLPILAGNRPVGLISSTDLIRHQGTNAVYLVRDIRRSESVAALSRVAASLPELQIHLVQSGATAFHMGQAISAVVGALTRRLLKLAVAELGPPPVAFAWLACGSQGRREQTVHTDQDSALVYADSPQAGVDEYFQRLAGFVTEGLARCGIPECPVGVSPRSASWRRSVSGWRDEFTRVIQSPERKITHLAAHYFDLRTIDGDESLFEPLRAEALRMAADRPAFLSRLGENALGTTPPLGFFRQLVLVHGGAQADTLDVKRQGLLPITSLARVYAVRAGVSALHTMDRLREAVRAGVISQDDGANLCGAYEHLATLRARHQASQIKAGLPPDNFIPPKTLSPLERGHLKDAFGVIATMQNNLRARLTGRGML
jgi:CBS domain-containing protein